MDCNSPLLSTKLRKERVAVQPHPEQSENVPAWFHHYALENERQHAALNQRITESETRLVRWVVGSAGVAAGVVVALSQLLEN